MKTKKRLEDYTWEELLEATSTKEALKEAGRDTGKYTLDNNLGIHNEDVELRKEWARMGGHASIDNLLKWQEENGHNIGEISKEKNEQWVGKISNSLVEYYQNNPMSDEVKNKISDTMKSKASKMTKEQRSKFFGNDSASRKSLKVRSEILDLISTDIFTTSDARKACKEYGLDNWKGFLKDNRIIEQIHKGTNQHNPSIYSKK
jgi:TusA-related sulfurtransferase